MFQIFSYFAKNAIEASLIVVYAKCMTGELERIAVKKTLPKNLQVLQVNALAPQRKALDVKTKQPIQMDVAIFTRFTKQIK
jgi:hypothetical protein